MAVAAASRLNVREEPIPHSELKSFDELFLADAAGITSLAECDGAKFMSLAAPRIAAALK
jgi:branched-subunit amino acid aminotransferase/4-amino-4-deoxychorismate lyase